MRVAQHGSFFRTLKKPQLYVGAAFTAPWGMIILTVWLLPKTIKCSLKSTVAHCTASLCWSQSRNWVISIACVFDWMCGRYIQLKSLQFTQKLLFGADASLTAPVRMSLGLCQPVCWEFFQCERAAAGLVSPCLIDCGRFSLAPLCLCPKRHY